MENVLKSLGITDDLLEKILNDQQLPYIFDLNLLREELKLEAKLHNRDIDEFSISLSIDRDRLFNLSINEQGGIQYDDPVARGFITQILKRYTFVHRLHLEWIVNAEPELFSLLATFEDLQEVRIENCRTPLPHNIFELNVTSLIIHHMPFALPQGLSNLSSLNYLELIDVQHHLLSIDFSRMNQLHYLNLRSNQLHSIPENIFEVQHLKVLDLSYNAIEEVGNKISELSSLQELYLSDNQIMYLNDGITTLNQLEVLDLSKNRVEKLPDEFVTLGSLRSLRLTSNSIRVLPYNFGNLQALEFLSLKSNRIHTLPQSIMELKNLQYLGLDLDQISPTKPVEKWLNSLKKGKSPVLH